MLLDLTDTEIKQFNLIALDPGGTTGYAVSVGGRFYSGQIGPTEHHRELYDVLNNYGPNETICERFEYRNTSRPGLELISREYIGVAKLFCSFMDQELILQTAAQGKGFVSDDNLKLLGLYEKGQQHARDAMRHLIYRIVNNKERKWPEARMKILELGYK